MPNEPRLLITIHKPGTDDEIHFHLGCEDLRQQALIARAAAKMLTQILVSPETLRDQRQLLAIANVLLDMADYGLGNITFETALFALVEHVRRPPPASPR